MSYDIFRGYCEQYARALTWFKHHQILVDGTDRPAYVSKFRDNNQGHKNGSMHRNQIGKRKNRGRTKKSKPSDTSYYEQDYASDKDHNNESFEMVVTDEMAEFFRISAEHKKERGWFSFGSKFHRAKPTKPYKNCTQNLYYLLLNCHQLIPYE